MGIRIGLPPDLYIKAHAALAFGINLDAAASGQNLLFSMVDSLGSDRISCCAPTTLTHPVFVCCSEAVFGRRTTAKSFS